MKPSIAIVNYFLYLSRHVKKSCGSLLWFKTKLSPPKTVPYVDLNRFSGKWFEIASIPQSYTEGAVGTTAIFGKLEGDELPITIRYYENNFNGPFKERKGTGEVVDKKTNAKLEVHFVWPFTSDFWVLDLGANYEYSAIGEPDRSSLWILSRTSTMTDEAYNAVVQRMELQQYDTSKLKKTKQK